MKSVLKNRAAVTQLYLLLGLLLLPLRAGAGDPDLVFRTIKTEHFEIHYHQGTEHIARAAATICEEVHQDLTILLEWHVDGPTHVVIMDHTDSANGVSYVLNRPLIRLYATAPNIDSSMQTYDNWLRTLFVHEYTHMISLRIHSGVARVINAIFGTVYLPNTISPTWYHEAITILNETYETTGGRIRSASYKMSMRTAALEGTLLSLGQVSNPFRAYPRGYARYLYGAMFFDYLRTRFGIDSIVQLYHAYGSDPIPYGLNRAFKATFGTDLVTLYDQWLDQVRTEAFAEKKKLEASGLTASTRITYDGETKGRPIFSPDGRSVMMAIGNGIERSGIFRVPLDGSERELLVLSDSRSPVSMDRSGRLFYNRTAPYNTYYHFSDVFVLDRPGVEPRRVTHGARSWAAAISPKGDVLALNVNQGGTSKLALADEQGNIRRTLVDSAAGDQVYAPAWSPDGERVAVVIRRGPTVDVAVVTVETGEVQFLTQDRALEDGPSFDASGRYLVFTSDRTGISNVYAYDFEAGQLYQVTNVLTGAYAPGVSPDGKTLAFNQYYSIGYDLHVMPFNPGLWRAAKNMDTEWQPMRALPAPSEAKTEPYNPLPTLAPSYWRLNLTMNSEWEGVLELITSLEDAVGRHRIAGQVDYRLDESVISGKVAYSYSGLGPSFNIGVSHRLDPRDSGYNIDGNAMEWTQKRTRANANLSFSIPRLDERHRLSIGYTIVHTEPVEDIAPVPDPTGDRPTIPDQFFRAGIDLSWRYDNTINSPLGISPHKGRKLAGQVSMYHPALGGAQTLAGFWYAWTEYVGMPWLNHHVVALRLNGGIYVSDPPKQASFAVGGYREQNIVDTIWNDAPAGVPTVRGYPQNAFRGDQFHALKLEYRFPIWFAEAAYATLPVFLKRIQCGIFSDNAVVSFESLDRDDWHSSLGMEIVWALTFSYFRSLSLRTGYAYGFMSQGIHEGFIVFGNSF
ncbi:MAG: BamA/TamA family outer membrane protein [Myxococcota bacterium]|nr:BamA/TamA family outer membrane protein [Myxococcota bacterium]